MGTTESRFHVFVVPRNPIGRATAEILTRALKRGRKVLRILDSGEMRKVTSIISVDERDWKTGWMAA